MAINVCKGDEIILPSYTFVSSALPFYNRGAIIKFADIDPVTNRVALEVEDDGERATLRYFKI